MVKWQLLGFKDVTIFGSVIGIVSHYSWQLNFPGVRIKFQEISRISRSCRRPEYSPKSALVWFNICVPRGVSSYRRETIRPRRPVPRQVHMDAIYYSQNSKHADTKNRFTIASVCRQVGFYRAVMKTQPSSQ